MSRREESFKAFVSLEYVGEKIMWLILGRSQFARNLKNEEHK